jgi:hypothetical protein
LFCGIAAASESTILPSQLNNKNKPSSKRPNPK